MRSILFVFEFPPSDSEWQLRDLADALRDQDGKIEIRFCSGWLDHYSPGGLRLRRLFSGMGVHVAAFFRVLFGNYDTVLVRSAPPLIQITVAFACAVRRMPYWVWLMDAHPEIETVLWEKKPMAAWICRKLEAVNRWALARAAIVIVLDPAMRARLVPRLPDSHVIVCPTWGRTVANTR